MSTVVFVGPTLEVERARRELDAVYLPPASQGDIYRASLHKPRAIGLIDGYFERVPAVWHKEILWAMSQGIHVFGAASMGALRAAELAAFGMVGIGRIFESFRDGHLEDDDEVTIAHAESSSGFLSLSEAMVNIRATLERACRDGIIAEATGTRLEGIAKALHFPRRSYPSMLEAAAEQGVAAVELAALERWLPDHAVDQKREDAIALLRAIRELQERDPGFKEVSFCFAHTDVWDQVSRRTGRQLAAALPDDTPAEALLDELRLAAGDRLDQLRTGARYRGLALKEAQHQGVVVGAELLRETMNTFFLERGLRRPDQIRGWMEEQELDKEGLALFMMREAQLRWVSTMIEPDSPQQIADQLRVDGSYAQLVGRARDKLRLLQTLGIDNPDLAQVGLSEQALYEWFFVERRGEAVPADMEGYLRKLGYADRESLTHSLLLEYRYLQHREGS